MTTINQTLPVITVTAIRENKPSIIKNQDGTVNTIDNVSVEFRKTVIDPGANSLFNLAFSRFGDSRISSRDKTLTFYMSMTKAAIMKAGFAIGTDINTLGHAGVYDIRERYRIELSADSSAYQLGNAKVMGQGGLDGNYNVVLSPVINPTSNEILLSGGQVIFRTTELVLAPSVEELPASDPKPVYDKESDGKTNVTVEGFAGEQKDEDGRKTPEYQDFLNNLYRQLNEKTSPVLVDTVTEISPEPVAA